MQNFNKKLKPAIHHKHFKYHSALLFYYVVYLNKTTFFGVFENIIGGFSILHPKMR
jgi:hypothetical protein